MAFTDRVSASIEFRLCAISFGGSEMHFTDTVTSAYSGTGDGNDLVGRHSSKKMHRFLWR
jgi:hypothetical protein